MSFKKLLDFTKRLPPSIGPRIITLAFNSRVKYAWTSGIRIEKIDERESIVTIRNRSSVQNHIGGVHACAMALIAETASGTVFSVHVPSTHVPVIKSMKIDYQKRAFGDLKAVATLTDDQISRITTEEKGDVSVNVKVFDETGKEPIACEMIWAWTRKRQSKD